jgi:biopolymer transport protein ExbB
LALFLERLWALRRRRVAPRSFFVEMEDLVRRHQIDEAATLCRKNDSILARIFYQGLNQFSLGLEAVKETLFEEAERQAFDLERGVGVIGMIMTLAPLLGFLGTVLGMVDLFSSIAAEGEVQNIGVIANGVYKALYTTVAGLTVAIPATLFHKYCLATVDQTLSRIEGYSLRLVGLLNEAKQSEN